MADALTEKTFQFELVSPEAILASIEARMVIVPGEALSVQEFLGETKLFGVYGSQQFGLNDRLFLTAAIRGDQNSAFGDNIGFVVYPAFSASWVVLEASQLA